MSGGQPCSTVVQRSWRSDARQKQRCPKHHSPFACLQKGGARPLLAPSANHPPLLARIIPRHAVYHKCRRWAAVELLRRGVRMGAQHVAAGSPWRKRGRLSLRALAERSNTRCRCHIGAGCAGGQQQRHDAGARPAGDSVHRHGDGTHPGASIRAAAGQGAAEDTKAAAPVLVGHQCQPRNVALPCVVRPPPAHRMKGLRLCRLDRWYWPVVLVASVLLAMCTRLAMHR